VNWFKDMFRRDSGDAKMRRPAKKSAQERPPAVIKSPREVQIMREAGRIVSRVHAALKEAIQPGVSTWDLDQLALSTIQKYNATSAFMGYRGFPANICASINDELVHGIPNRKRVLRSGDIVSIDVGVNYRGFIGDSAWTYAVGEISPAARELMQVTEASLFEAIKAAKAGNRVIDVSRAVQRYVEAHKMHIVREYTGHGVGRQMHEGPQILNYVSEDVDSNFVLQPGLVLAIEPMVQRGTWQTKVLKDKWTVVSLDGSLAAHFEHTIAITNNGAEILTLP
jgi:methionyl aminopeptidase